MRLVEHIRTNLRRQLTGEDALVLDGDVPDAARALAGATEVGLYLHVPFCRRICPYCPYHKVLCRDELLAPYTDAVEREVDRYAEIIADRPVTSFYVGGGTPTVMLGRGLERLLEHIGRVLPMRCSAHVESHPNDLTDEALDALVGLGVGHLSIGIEALQDRHLRTLHRPYTADGARAAVRRATARPFRCVSADMMFDLPGQTLDEAVDTARALVDLGADQVAAYPLFTFPHTPWGNGNGHAGPGLARILRRRRILHAIEEVLASADYRRTSVWAFTRGDAPPYCSVTVPLYVGLGAGGGSYLREVFYLNTFDVPAYIEAMQADRSPVALSVTLSPRMQMAGWLYWRLYSTRFGKRAFRERFGVEFDDVYGRLVGMLATAGMLYDDGREIRLSSSGAYWLHVVQDLFSLDAVGRLWGAARATAWPEAVAL